MEFPRFLIVKSPFFFFEQIEKTPDLFEKSSEPFNHEARALRAIDGNTAVSFAARAVDRWFSLRRGDMLKGRLQRGCKGLVINYNYGYRDIITMIISDDYRHYYYGY